MCVVFAGGVLFPCGVSVTDSGGGDAHQAGAGESRAGEIPAVQRHLQRNEEGEGNVTFTICSWLNPCTVETSSLRLI